MSRHRRASRLLAIAGSLGVALALVATPASADPSLESGLLRAAQPAQPGRLARRRRLRRRVRARWQRGLRPAPRAGKACLGLQRVDHLGEPRRCRQAGRHRAPSIASELEALGPMDLIVRDNDHYIASIGIGGDEALRDEYGKAGEHLGTLVSGKLGSDEHEVFADILGHRGRGEPRRHRRRQQPRGHRPGGRRGRRRGRRRQRHRPRERGRRVRTVATLDPTDEGADAVPTAVVRGPDGAWYVSQLTGFPFTKGSASIWRIGSSGEPKVYASGLTNVTDLAFHGRTLYAVQIATDGLLSGPRGPGDGAEGARRPPPSSWVTSWPPTASSWWTARPTSASARCA